MSKKINRNQPCPCGSGLKRKKCHSDPVKTQAAAKAFKDKVSEIIMDPLNQALCKKASEDKMNELITEELRSKKND